MSRLMMGISRMVTVNHDVKRDLISPLDMVPGVVYMVGVCMHCGELYEATRTNKRGHESCMNAARKRRERDR